MTYWQPPPSNGPYVGGGGAGQGPLDIYFGPGAGNDSGINTSVPFGGGGGLVNITQEMIDNFLKTPGARGIFDNAIYGLPNLPFPTSTPQAPVGGAPPQPANTVAPPPAVTPPTPTAQPPAVNPPIPTPPAPTPATPPPIPTPPPTPQPTTNIDDTDDQAPFNINFPFPNNTSDDNDMSYDSLFNSGIDVFGELFGSDFDSLGGSNASNNQNQNTANGGAGGTGGQSTSNNSITDLLSNVGNTVINAGATNYAADQQLQANREALEYSQGIYNNQVDRLEPFRQSGLNAIGGAQSAANTNPEVMNMFQGQQNINPNTNVQGANAGQVDVNQINPFDRNSEALRFLQDEQMAAVNNGFAAQGKLGSGGRYRALQDRAANVASTYAGQMQGISSAQDQSNLASDSQRFGQEFNNAGFDLGQDQANVANGLNLNNQLFGQRFDSNSFNQNADNNEFNQLFSMMNAGGSAAAGQGYGMNQASVIGSGMLENEGDIRTGRAGGYANALAGLFK